MRSSQPWPITIVAREWIHSLRPDGDKDVTARVKALLQSGEACWCAMVKLELRNGARGEHEKCVLREMENELLELEISPAVWTLACDLARKARASGETLPTSDILIEACARHHVIEIEHADEH